MLYVSTRSRTDSFTAHRALHETRAPDGGLFVPFRIPAFSKEEIRQLKENSFGENVAQILNLFFSTGLNGWDVDFAIGRRPVRIATMTHRLYIGELWHNLESEYAYTERILYNKLAGTTEKIPTDWSKIAIRIAVLFGVFGELSREGVRNPDIAVPSGDFSLPMAVWYARKMGLPIGRIICGCNENGGVWDLIQRGEFSTGASVVHTDLPELDHACPTSIERLVFTTLGLKEAQRYVDICAQRGVYALSEDDFRELSNGLFAAVVSNRRTLAVISSTYRSNQYVTDGYAAVAFGGLQDYRASTGESCNTLILADKSPVLSALTISKILGVSQDELRKML